MVATLSGICRLLKVSFDRRTIKLVYLFNYCFHSFSLDQVVFLFITSSKNKYYLKEYHTLNNIMWSIGIGISS